MLFIVLFATPSQPTTHLPTPPPSSPRHLLVLLSVSVPHQCLQTLQWHLADWKNEGFVGWLVGRLTSQQQASVSQRQICSNNFTCCHTEIEVADETFYLTQSQYTDTGPTSPSANPVMPGAWEGSHWSANF